MDFLWLKTPLGRWLQLTSVPLDQNQVIAVNKFYVTGIAEDRLDFTEADPMMRRVSSRQ